MSRIITLIILIPFFSYAQGQYSIVKERSSIKWMANYVMGKGHNGTLDLIAGNLTVDAANQITLGNFAIDMNAIGVDDIKDERSRKDLIDHLRSPDFFDTKMFPTAGFAITQVTPVEGKTNEFMITGFLSLRGVTNQIRFPAKIELTHGTVTAKGEVVIDRTKWNIYYQSGSIFTTLKSGVISDDIKVTLDLVFRRRE